MDIEKALSSRIVAAFEGCYEGPRAAALSGVPKSTVYHWARTGVVKPSVSQTRVKLWSYADLMALRIVSWLRHPKRGHNGVIPGSPMRLVREALEDLNRKGIDIWDDSRGRPDTPLRVDSSAGIWEVSKGVTKPDGTQALPGVLELLGPFEYGDQIGPDLICPRPSLRIIPGKVSGEPHLAGSRITTRTAAALFEKFQDYDRVAELYPGFDTRSFKEAIQFEHSLAA